MKKLLGLGLAALLLLATGCRTTPVVPPSPTSTAPTDPAVKTDWSRLTPYKPEAPLYTRRYADFTDTLRPADDYGPLIPYTGIDYGYVGRRYGLVTLQGELITDPVFTNVWRGGSGSGYHDNPPLPYLMLTKGTSSPSRDEWPGPERWAMAAPDGSWCTPFQYTMDSELVIWGRSGNPSCTEDGLFVLDGGALVYLDGATGAERVRIPLEGEWYQISSVLYSACWVNGKVFYRREASDRDGKSYYRSFRFDPATGQNEELSREKWDELTSDGPPSMGVEPEFVDGHELHGFIAGGDGWRWYRDGGELVFLRDGEEKRLKTDATPDDVMWGRVVFLHTENWSAHTYLTLDGKLLAQYPKGPWVYDARGYDPVTGAKYLRLANRQGYDLFDENGEQLASVTAPVEFNSVELTGGLVFVTTSDACTLRTRSGELIFRYPLAPGELD